MSTDQSLLTDVNLATQLEKAARLLNQRQPAEARAAIGPVASVAPEHPSVLYLLGGASRLEGDLQGAEGLYRRSLARNPQQPQVLHALGVALKEQGRDGDAMSAFRDAVRLEPRYHEAWINLGRTALSAEDLATAEEAFGQAATLRPDDARAFTGLARLHRTREQFGEAIALADRALSLTPAYVVAHRVRAQCLADLGRLEEALDGFEAALSHQPNDPATLQEAGRAAFRIGRHSEAIAHLRSAVALTPFDAQVHRDLNQILYMLGDEAFLTSYAEPLRKQPDNVELMVGYALSAMSAGRAAEARAAIDAARARGVRDVRLDDTASQLAGALGDGEAAVSLGHAAFTAAPHDPYIAQNYCATQLRFGGAREALEVANKAVELDPHDQTSRAYQVTALRLAGDDSAGGLFDIERFTDLRSISCPPGYDSLEAFNQELADLLTRLHTSAHEPLDQSLRGGTQVELTQLGRAYPTIALLIDALKANVAEFTSALPSDPHHPFLSRRPSEIEFSGVWSVRLRSGGRHVSHAHPQGWLSSCYYVDVPDVVADVEGGHQGHFMLGVPPADNLAAETIPVYMQPAPGKLALFPSYFWHGTAPFTSEQHRLTVAFDVKPAKLH